MIPSKELRLGNLSIDQQGEVVTINYIGKMVHIDGVESITLFKPIPLTEEWLLKLGFRKKENYDDEYGDLYEIESFGGFYINKDGSLKPKPYYFADAFNNDLKIKYVHQLQNLYFALTGEELTLSSPPNGRE